MKVRMMRSGSLGLEGTLKNANHHAQLVLPLIEYMVKKVEGAPFVEWIQGHNVHVLVAEDGRKFVFRPIYTKKGVVGVKIGIRVSRTKELHLFNIEHDEDYKMFVSEILYRLPEPELGNQRGVSDE